MYGFCKTSGIYNLQYRMKMSCRSSLPLGCYDLVEMRLEVVAVDLVNRQPDVALDRLDRDLGLGPGLSVW